MASGVDEGGVSRAGESAGEGVGGAETRAFVGCRVVVTVRRVRTKGNRKHGRRIALSAELSQFVVACFSIVTETVGNALGRDADGVSCFLGFGRAGEFYGLGCHGLVMGPGRRCSCRGRGGACATDFKRDTMEGGARGGILNATVSNSAVQKWSTVPMAWLKVGHESIAGLGQTGSRRPGVRNQILASVLRFLGDPSPTNIENVGLHLHGR